MLANKKLSLIRNVKMKNKKYEPQIEMLE